MKSFITISPLLAIALVTTGCPLTEASQAITLRPASGTTYDSAQTVAVTVNIDMAALQRSSAAAQLFERVEFRHEFVSAAGAAPELRCTDVEAPYECEWNITAGDNGTHRWFVTLLTPGGTILGGAASEVNVDILPIRTLGTGGGTALFSSGWETALGNSDQAVSDGARWDDPHECDYGGGRGCEVVRGEQCASGNCLCFLNGPDAGAPSLRINDGFPMASSSDVYQRLYVWVPTDQIQPWGRMHWLQDPGDRTDGTQNVMFGTDWFRWVDVDGDGDDDAIGATFYIGQVGVNQTGGFEDHGSNMDCGTQTAITEFPVRVELHTHLLDHADRVARVQHHIRIYDGNGRLAIDDSDFLCDDGLTLSEHYGRGDTLNWDGDETTLHLGNNDVGADNPTMIQALCVDEYAFGIDGWLGSCTAPGCF